MINFQANMRANLLQKLTIVAFTLGLASCGQVESNEPKPIRVDGSSTVYPITEVISQKFKTETDHKASLSVAFSGTGGGFQKFCNGETDISGASRPISAAEMTTCKNNKVAYIELPVAFDALTVVVNTANNWVDSLTMEELRQMWQPEAQNTITRWQDIRPNWPDQPLNLFGPGGDSGTYDYFTEIVNGKADSSRQDYVYSEDDFALVNGIAQDPNALGYFGFSYYEQNQDKLKAIAIDSGNGPVLPSPETVENAEYQPLARPLFIYVNAKAAQDNIALKDFVEFYLQNAPELVSQVGYIPLSEEGYHLAKIHFERGKVGTVFEGKSAFNLTMGELLRKQATF
jgi:phosphate transport system substrate-binding protein